MRLARTATLIALALPAVAAASTYNLSPQCALKRYSGSAWEPMAASALPGRIRDPLTQKGGKTLFQISGKWYMTDPECLTQNRIDSGPRPSVRGIEHSRASGPEWSIELAAGVGLLLGSRFQARTETTGGYTITTPAASKGIYLAFGGTYELQDDLALRYFMTRQSSTAEGAFGGSVTGAIKYENDYYHFGAGLVKRWGHERLRPYAEIDAGYALDSGLWTLSGFSGIFEGLNGQVDINSGGIFAGARGGVEWLLPPSFSVFAEILFHHAFLGKRTVKATTTSLYTEGLELESQPVSRALLSVGGRYSF